MTAKAFITALPSFVGLDGLPLSGGYVYFGEPSQDPRDVPKSVFFDQALAVPAAQPLRTQAGLLYRNGSPTNVWANGNCSVLVLDANQRQVYYFADWAGSGIVADVSDVAAIAANVTAVAAVAASVVAVAGDLPNINTVAGDVANIDAVAGDVANINAVAGDLPNINTVAGDVGNINTVAGAVANVNLVAGAVANVNIVAGDKANVDLLAANITAVQQALAAGKIYATTADGIANTSGAGTTNRYFFVPSAATTESLLLYINNAGVAALVKTYSSKQGIDALVYGSTTGIRASSNLLTGLAWNANTLMWNDGHTSALAGYSCTNLLPVWPGEVIQIICGVNHAAQTATVNSYDESGTFVSNLLLGAVPVHSDTGAQADNPQYLAIPAGVRSIRIGQQVSASLTTLTVISSPEKYATDNLNAKLKTTAETNLLGPLRYCPGAAGAVLTSNSSSTKGTGWLPVTVGDTIRWCVGSSGGFYGLALYDAGKTFLRFLEQNNSSLTVEKSYTLNAVDDATVAYMLGGHFNLNNAAFYDVGYIYLSSKKSLDSKITDLSGPGRGRGWRKSKVLTWTNIAGTTVAATGGVAGVTRVTTTASPAFVAPSVPEKPREGYTSGFRAVKVKLVAMPGASAKLYWTSAPLGVNNTTDPVNVTSGNNTATTTTVLTAVGQVAVMYAPFYPGASIRCDDGAGVQFDIIDSFNVEFSDAMATPEKFDAMWSILANAPRFFEEQYNYADMALEALTANRYKTFVYGKKVAVFGNSLTYTLWTQGNYLEGPLGCTITDCTTGGSTFVTNLTDANLALIPADVTLVIIASGNTGTDPLAPDVTSRDRTKCEGAVNYAIDWIYTNRPNARVMMITSEYCTSSGVNGTAALNDRIRAICAYRHIPYADSHFDSNINESNYTAPNIGIGDGVHLGTEGKARRAGVIIGKIRSMSA